MNVISSGEITNLLSNDANKAQMALYFMNYLWVKFRSKRFDIKLFVGCTFASHSSYLCVLAFC